MPEDFEVLLDYIRLFKQQFERASKPQTHRKFPARAIWKNGESEELITLIHIAGILEGSAFYQPSTGGFKLGHYPWIQRGHDNRGFESHLFAFLQTNDLRKTFGGLFTTKTTTNHFCHWCLYRHQSSGSEPSPTAAL